MELQDPSRLRRASPPPRYSTTEDRAEEAEHESEIADIQDEWTEEADGLLGSRTRRDGGQVDLPLRLCIFVGVSWTIGLYSTYPAPTTIPLFIGSAFILAGWVVLTWTRLFKDLAQGKESVTTIKARYPLRCRISIGLATALVLWWISITLLARAELAPLTMVGNGDRYFIAVNLHNNEAILHDFIQEVTMLLFHRKCYHTT